MSFLDVLLDFIFPRDCFYCKRPLDGSQKGFICNECFGKIVFNRGVRCNCCGRLLTTEAVRNETDKTLATVEEFQEDRNTCLPEKAEGADQNGLLFESDARGSASLRHFVDPQNVAADDYHGNDGLLRSMDALGGTEIIESKQECLAPMGTHPSHSKSSDDQLLTDKHDALSDVSENGIQPIRCLNCTELQPFFDRGTSLFAFTGVGRAFVHTLKYHNGTYLHGDLQRLFAHEATRLEDLKGGIFVPVPLHFFRQWRRGYNQSNLIANALAKSVGGSMQRLLRRRRHTPSQTNLTKAERKQNVRGAFCLRRFATIDPKAAYVLTDDVFTTGATLNECARVLKKHGATIVRVFTLAHG